MYDDDIFDFSKPYRRTIHRKDGTILDFNTREVLRDANGVWHVEEAEEEIFGKKKIEKKKM